MSILALVLFALTLALLFADVVAAACVRAMQRVGVLPPPVVVFDGLLGELYALWPQEQDERSDDEILEEEWSRLQRMLRAA